MTNRNVTLTAHFAGDADSLLRALQRVDREAAKTERTTGRLSGAMGTLRSNWIAVTAAAAAFTAATAGVTAATISAINAASDYEESVNKIDVVFQSSADSVRRWVEEQALAFRLSNREAAAAVGTFGNLFAAMGQSTEASAEMSIRLTELAGDLSSFNNIATSEALTSLRAGIVGEIEPLRRLGVSFNAAAVEAKALELGLAATKAELDEGDKVLARYQLILDQTTTAQGDAARTSKTWAAETKELRDRVDNLKVEIGNELLPAATEFLDTLNEIIEINGEQWAVSFADAVRDLGDAFGWAATRLRELRDLAAQEGSGASATAGFPNPFDFPGFVAQGVRDVLGGPAALGGALGLSPSDIFRFNSLRNAGLTDEEMSGLVFPDPLTGFDLFSARDRDRFTLNDPDVDIEDIWEARRNVYVNQALNAAGFPNRRRGARGPDPIDPFELAQQRALQLAAKNMESLAFQTRLLQEAQEELTQAMQEARAEITDVGGGVGAGGARFVWVPDPTFVGDPRFNPGITFSSADVDI